MLTSSDESVANSTISCVDGILRSTIRVAATESSLISCSVTNNKGVKSETSLVLQFETGEHTCQAGNIIRLVF